MKLNNIKQILLAVISAILLFSSCNDDFMEKSPKVKLSTANAFKTYANFKAYMYPNYEIFTDQRIYTNFSEKSYYYGGQYKSDFWAGIMTNRDTQENPYAYQTITATTSSTNWDFSYIRSINVMLDHLDQSELTEAEKKHWTSVGYFFHAFWYMELVSKYGDVPWIDSTLTEVSEEAYGPRTPRAEVVEKIIERLEYAIANIGDTSGDGDNPVTANAIKAALSRFLLREGTWAKYHGLNEPYQVYLEKCLKISKELMDQYPTLHQGSGLNKYPGAGYDEVLTSEDLSDKAGVIMYKQYINGILMHRFSDLIHIAAHAVDAPQSTVDLFLMNNGKPINHTESGFKGGEGKDLWDYYADRDPRLHINFQPPVQVKLGSFPNPDNVTTFKKWTFYTAGDQLNNKEDFIVTPEYESKFRTYIDYFGPNITCEDGTGDESIGVKRLPGHNWSGSMSRSAPNIVNNQTEGYMRSRSGYYFWKNFTMWEKGSNGTNQTSDKPIFTIEEVLLNYAEAAYELGKFDQAVADMTINKLRERVGVAPMVVAEIDADFDPNRDRGDAAWTRGYGAKTNYEVSPVLWEIRRERLVELMGQGFSFYDVKRWHKAPYYINRQPCGAWLTAENVPYGNGKYTGQFVDYNEIQKNGYANPMTNAAGSGWIYTKPGPLSTGKGWLDTYYLEMIPTDQIKLNPQITQNPGWNELFGL